MTVEAHEKIHISSFIVRCLPEKLQQVMAAVEAMPGLEIHGNDPCGKCVALLELEAHLGIQRSVPLQIHGWLIHWYCYCYYISSFAAARDMDGYLIAHTTVADGCQYRIQCSRGVWKRERCECERACVCVAVGTLGVPVRSRRHRENRNGPTIPPLRIPAAPATARSSVRGTHAVIVDSTVSQT